MSLKGTKNRLGEIKVTKPDLSELEGGQVSVGELLQGILLVLGKIEFHLAVLTEQNIDDDDIPEAGR